MVYNSINHLKRIKKTNKLLKEEKTGTPEIFAKQLNIGKRQLYNILENMKIIGASIKYCRKRETFFYDDEFDLQINYSVKVIKNETMNKVYGGNNIYESKLFRAMKFHWIRIHLFILFIG